MTLICVLRVLKLSLARTYKHNLHVVQMFSVLRAADIPLCFVGGSSTCAKCPAMPDGDFVILRKAHAYVKSKTKSKYDCFPAPSDFGLKYNEVEGKINIWI